MAQPPTWLTCWLATWLTCGAAWIITLRLFSAVGFRPVLLSAGPTGQTEHLFFHDFLMDVYLSAQIRRCQCAVNAISHTGLSVLLI